MNPAVFHAPVYYVDGSRDSGIRIIEDNSAEYQRKANAIGK